jgi:hypothetical protein
MGEPGKQWGSLAAWGILGVFLALCAALVVSPHVMGEAIEQRLAGQRESLNDVLARLREAGRRAGRVAKGSEQAPPRAAVVFEGPSESVVGAGLQKLLIDLVQKHGGKVRTIQVLPSRPLAAHVRVGVGLTADLTLTGLRDLLVDVERHQPVLIVDQARIARAAEPRRQRAARSDIALDLNLVVGAYFARGRKS